MKKQATLFFLLALTNSVSAQEEPDPDMPNKGTYLFHGQPVIEDNSMFIEEAFNQEEGVVQYISNLVVEDASTTYSFCNEIPLADYHHQLSIAVGYTSLDDGNAGFNDVEITYRPSLTGKFDWALVAPAFTLILPTGDASKGLGDGAFGGSFNLAISKRLMKGLVTHWNAGYTMIGKAKTYGTGVLGENELIGEREVGTYNLGASAIWMIKDNFNLMAEYLYEGTMDDGVFSAAQTFNPGFRTAAQIGKAQIVPGLGLPFYEENGLWKQRGVFVYLSIEPAF